MAALHENAAGLSEMMTALAGVEICKEPWRIYYDETENCRSIAYRNGAIADVIIRMKNGRCSHECEHRPFH